MRGSAVWQAAAMHVRGAPGRIRTCDLRLRSPLLCPTELPGRDPIVACRGCCVYLACGLMITQTSCAPSLKKITDSRSTEIAVVTHGQRRIRNFLKMMKNVSAMFVISNPTDAYARGNRSVGKSVKNATFGLAS